MQERLDTRTVTSKKSDDTTHLVIYFCGTGNSGESFEQAAYPILKDVNSKVTTIFVEGCHHPDVCNSVLNPDLSEFAARFTKSVFRTHDGQLLLNPQDLKNLHVGIKWVTDASAKKPISKISLVGYSRGAVTTFELAKELNNLQKASESSVPVRIIAEQPVPGNYTDILPNSVAGHAADCRDATNIESATIILAGYAPQLAEELTAVQKIIHSNFFSQMIPQLPKGLEPQLIFIPRLHHWSPVMAHELNLVNELMKGLNEDDLISAHTVSGVTTQLKEYYAKFSYQSLAFPEPSQLQSIFNVCNKTALYQHIDENHPAPYLRAGFNWKKNKETLRQCWDRHDKSWYHNEETKALLEKIDAANLADSTESLIKLYDATKNWLAHSKSDASNHELVVSLRSQLYFILTQRGVHNLDEVPVARVESARNRSGFFSSYSPTSMEDVSDYFHDMNPSRPK